MLHCPQCGRTYPAEIQICPDDKSPLQADSTVAGNVVIDPLLGLTLDDKYRLEERLGVGGMGTVYRARHVLIDRPVAVKVLNPRFVEDEAARIRFRREARAAGRLQHTNAVTVTDFGQTPDGYVYLVMELLQGRTLRDVIAKEAPLDPARAVSIMLQAADAVAAAHEAGIIHRDLKPANIFIVQRAEVPSVVKVLDFGIAKVAAESLDDDDPKTLTMVGAMIGTPRYMSPEQCDGAELSPAADVYSLGVILYEMLTGAVPFSGSTPLAIALKHATDPPRSLREIVTSIPLELERVVLHALEKSPKDRPADAGAFRKELFETAEALGLEHSGVSTGPDIEVLRNIGTESPSGRLVIDISRLRENRAATSGASELTVISEAQAAQVLANKGQAESAEAHQQKPQFARVAVPLGTRGRSNKVMAATVLVSLVALVVALTVFAMRRQNIAPAANQTIVATPTPTPEPTPTPTPTPVRAERKPTPTPAPKKKKESRVKSILRKLNPF